jgi:hypothetical protein
MKADLIDHFNRQFATLDTLFTSVNDEAWRGSDQRLKGIWQWMAHVLEVFEYYFGEQSHEEFQWGHRFGVDWEIPKPETIPSPDDMRQYLEDVRRLAIQQLERRSEEDFAAPETVHKWTGSTFLARMLYLLRHTQQHIGDMNRVLAFHGCDRMKWH